MKKIAIFLFIIIVIVATMYYLYLNNIFNLRSAEKENSKFELSQGQEVYGSDLATLINRAIDSNNKNEIKKDNKGKYIENDKNSIKMDIKFTDTDVTYDMETIYNGKIQEFVNYYGGIRFKCTEVQYHNSTGLIKYIKFEQFVAT